MQKMKLLHVTKSGHCAFCGAKVRLCLDPKCGEFFHPTRDGHIYCRTRCRVRKFRANSYKLDDKQ